MVELVNFADMAEQIIEYYRKHRKIIEENIELSRDPGDVEAIHNLRLSIKRMRVVAMLAEILSRGKFNRKQQLKDIRKMFRSAGRLRDVQVALQLLKEYEDDGLQSVINHLEVRELKNRRRYEYVLSGFDPAILNRFEDSLSETLADIGEREMKHAGYKLLSDLEFDIHSIYHGSREEKRLHRIRRRLKDINYLNNIFNESLPVADHLNISADKLREISELAGTWHDCLMLEIVLGKTIAKYPDSSDDIVQVLSKINIKKKGLHDEYVCILLNEMKI